MKYNTLLRSALWVGTLIAGSVLVFSSIIRARFIEMRVAHAAGNTITAASCSQTDVQAAINQASNGDTVIIPSGTCTWSSQVTDSVGIILQGQSVCAGSGDPNGGTSGVISCTDNTIVTWETPGGLSVNVPSGQFVNITGFTFINAESEAGGGISGNHGQVDFRFHNNHVKMTQPGAETIFFYNGYGLIDHNYFQDMNSPGTTSAVPLDFGGDLASSGYLNWQDPTGLGTNQSIIAEQNYFTTSACGSGSTEGFYDAYYGAKVTVRYNTIVGCNDWGSHGYDSGEFRSVVVNEVYGNHVTNSSGLTSKLLGIRGGTLLYWGNIQDGSTPVGPADLQYFRFSQQNPYVGTWGTALPTVNWTPVSANITADGSTYNTANAPDFQTSHSYAANAVVGPLSNNAGGNFQGVDHGGYNFILTNGPKTCGSTYPSSWNQTLWGTTTDNAGCIWENIGGTTTASPNPGSAAGFLSTAPDTTCTSGVNCTRYVDANGGYPYRDQPCLGQNQTLMPCYEWLNNGLQLPNPVFSTDAQSNSIIVQNRDYYDYTASFNGTSGVGAGLLSARPLTCTTGVAYWATDQGSWNVSGNGTGQGVLYQCSSTNTWTVYYTPYTYPDPLDTSSGDDTVPPTVSLTSPASGATVSSTVILSANASDNVGVSSVPFSVDGTVVGTDTTSPYTFSWNSTSVPNGSYTITATAVDTSGNQATSNAVTVTVLNSSGVSGGGTTISLVSSTSTYTTSGALNTTGATVLVAFVGSDSSQSNAPSDSQSNTWTLATTTKVSTAYLSIYYVCNPTVASNQTFTSKVLSGGAILLVSAFSGTATSSCLDTYNGNGTTTNTDTITTGSVTPAASGELLVTDALKINGGIDTFSINDGFSLLDQPTAFTPISADAYLVASNTNPIDPTWTNAQSVTDLVANIIAFKAAPDTTPPTTSITSPLSGATVSSTISISAVASDNVGVASVRLYLDGSLIGTDASSPCTFLWNTTGSSNGSHTLQTKAYDAAGNVGSSAIVTVTVSNVVVGAPVITSASSSSATVNVPFSYQITATNSPASFNATNLPAGLSVNAATGIISGTPTSAGISNITISATNSAGTGAATLTLTISNAPDTTPPSIPTNLSIAGTTTSTVSLSWTASTDPTVNGQTTSGLAGYKIYRGGVQVGTSTNTSYTDSGLAASTTYSYTVASYDNAGNVSAQSASVNGKTTGIPDTTPPTTSITSPTNNATISGTITVSASASDNVGVVSVNLLVDNTVVATDTTSPYTFSLNTNALANGSHTLETKAYDAAGNVGTSPTVSVTVSNIPQTLTASLSASANSGTAPLTVSLTASAAGTASGTLNYIFYCNRSDTGTNITSPADLTINATNQNPYIASNLCSYQTAGTYTAKVIVEEGSAPPSQAQQTITVSNPVNQTSTPLISSVTVGQITDTSAQVTITTSATSSVVVNYGTSQSYGLASLASPNLTTIYVNLANLTQNTQYDFDVVAIAQGTTTAITSQNFSFTTNPTQGSGGGGGGGSSSGGGGGGGGSSGGGGGSPGGGGSSGGGSSSGGTGLPSFTQSVTITTSTQTSAKIAVVTSLPATTTLDYGRTAQYGVALASTLPLTTTYFNLPNLIPNATYYLKAISTADGQTISKTLSFIPGQEATAVPETPTSTTSLPPFVRNLTVGSTGSDDLELQQLLNQWGYTITSSGPGSPGNETTYFGSLTAKAVQKFQAANDISPVSGYVGPLTRAKLNSLIGNNGTPVPTTPAVPASGSITQNLSVGDSGLEVTLLQQLLTSDGDYTGPMTGYYGSLTEQAVQAFQTKYGIVTYGTPDTTGYGAVGPKTRNQLEML